MSVRFAAATVGTVSPGRRAHILGENMSVLLDRRDVSTMVKVGEYMAIAKPVAAYDLTETRRTAEWAGLFARPNEVRDLARCNDVLLEDDELRARLGAAGRAHAESTRAWEHSIGALTSAYERAPAGSTA